MARRTQLTAKEQATPRANVLVRALFAECDVKHLRQRQQ